MKTGKLLALALGYCLALCGVDGADAFPMPRGLTTARIGVGLKEFVAAHRDLQTGAIFGTTNINVSQPDQTVASVKKFFDPELGTLGTASTSLSIRNFVFKNGQMAEATLMVSGNPEYLRTIQKTIIADCYAKYGSNCVQSVREEKAPKDQRVKLLSFAWQLPTHYIVMACPPLSETNDLAATTAVFCVETNNAPAQKWLAGDPCSEAERQALFNPLVEAAKKPKP